MHSSRRAGLERFRFQIAACVLVAACLCGVAAAQEKLSYADIVGRLYDLQQLAEPPAEGERSGNFSSWDRGAKHNAQTRKYENWHANRDGGGFIRKEGDDKVAAEMKGPGVIWRVWSALPKAGKIRIYIDGNEKPALDIPFKEYFNNKEGMFAYPALVHVLSRGNNSFVPIPYAKSCKVVLSKGWGAYYQITYSTFPATTVVPSFTGSFSEADRSALAAANKAFAERGKDPKPPAGGQQTESKTVTIAPGASVDVCRLTGRRAITQLHVVPDAKDASPIRTLRELALSIAWDDGRRPAVWTPLGDFFGTAPGINRFKSLPTGMTKDGFYAYWYMPFTKSARLTVANDGARPRTLGVKVVHQPIRTDKPLLRFHAKWHRDSYAGVDERSFTQGDRWPDWPMLATQGRGRFVGVNLHVWNPNPFGKVTKVLDVDAKQLSPRIFGTMRAAARGWWWGEGDEKFLVDGEKMPSTFGTGSEDYFGYAWAAHNPVEFESALQNQPLNKNNSLGHVSNNRFHIADNVPFQKRFEAVIEKYHPNSWPLLYACTAYWYQAAGQADLYGPVPAKERVDYYIQPTRKALVPADGVYEGEQHLMYDPPARVQGMRGFGGGWSGGHQLLWHGKIGDEVSVTFEVKQQYRGPMSARFTLAPDYGVFDVLLDGKVLKKGIDLYDPKVIPAPKQTLAAVELSPGKHKLTFRLTGSNKQAKRFQGKFYMLGLDYIALTPGGNAAGDGWDMGPFVKREQPILRPTPDSRFRCPIRGKEVRWEEQNVYNPAAVVRNGKVYLLYRADDRSPDLKWRRTCRIGLAHSADGVNFTRHAKPVLYPDNDPWKEYEWEGGCEDLHIVESEDGTYYMNYTTWNGKRDTMSVATSRDLYHWTKHGPAFRKAAPEKLYGSRSGVVVSRLRDNRLIATKIGGKYWMYYTHPCALAWSDNLIDWAPTGKSVWGGSHETGAVALLREGGILLMFQGPHSSLGAWTLRQALIDRNDLTTVREHQERPFLFPEYDWEKRGFTGHTTVANGLVYFKGKWLLYYGAADRVIGLATCAKDD